MSKKEPKKKENLKKKGKNKNSEKNIEILKNLSKGKNFFSKISTTLHIASSWTNTSVHDPWLAYTLLHVRILFIMFISFSYFKYHHE